MGVVSPKLRASARNQPCMFRTPVCNHDATTTVLCHIRDDAKGMGNKANDWSAAFGCTACHEAIDQHKFSREDELEYSLKAMQRTQAYWVLKGLIIVPESGHRDKPSSKILPATSLFRSAS